VQFRLEKSDRSSHVVRSLLEKQSYVVDDCVRAAQGDEFHFLNETQPTYLRSLFVCPIHELPMLIADDRVELVSAVIVADSDLPNYFQQELGSIYREAVVYFSTRLQLEFNLQILLKRG
jgi:hypothetical protein